MKKIKTRYLIYIMDLLFIIFAVIYAIVVGRKIDTYKEEIKNYKLLTKELEDNRNNLITENTYLRLQNEGLWNFYYNNVSEYKGEYYE